MREMAHAEVVALCERCQTKGAVVQCYVCRWRGRASETRSRDWHTMHSYYCPECHDEQDLDCLEEMELSECHEVFDHGCHSCGQIGDQHVHPFGEVPAARGVQPSHTLVGLTCWCEPNQIDEPGRGRVIVHRAVEVE